MGLQAAVAERFALLVQCNLLMDYDHGGINYWRFGNGWGWKAGLR